MKQKNKEPEIKRKLGKLEGRVTVNGQEPTEEEQKLIEQHNLLMKKRTFENALMEQTTRARSVVVGTAFGGTSELSMRRADGTVTFVILQPVEVIELIHQLSASVGCHIHIQPRKDFSSWRQWNVTQEALNHFRGENQPTGAGHPPGFEAISPESMTTSLPPPELQPGLNLPNQTEISQQLGEKLKINIKE